LPGRNAFFKDIYLSHQNKLTVIFDAMKDEDTNYDGLGVQLKGLLYKRWPWHVLFWTGYILFRFYIYYITVKYYDSVFLEYMLLAEVGLVMCTYFTLWLYSRLFKEKKYLFYFAAGTITWLLYLYARTVFQFWYLRNERSFQGVSFSDMFINNITFVLVYFLFLTACKYFKDGYIQQQFDAQKKQAQLLAEVNNLKSQIAPHFLFNTLNNLYGLAVEKSDKLPGLMLTLSDLLRHSLYETQKPLIGINEEIDTLKSYANLESIRLEDDLKLQFDDEVPGGSPYLVAPLLLIVFIENAFKHAKAIRSGPVDIYIRTLLDGERFTLEVRNNYNEELPTSPNGIGLTNVKRRLDVLYPGLQHLLTIHRGEYYFTVSLTLQLVKDPAHGA
jgi:two-component system sensor histidine kinase LytS